MKTYNQFINESIKNKKFILLVGPPSTGKSTYIKQHFKTDYIIIERDKIVNDIAKEFGFTYDDCYEFPKEGMVVGDKDPKYGEVIEAPDEMNSRIKLLYDKVLEANIKIKETFTKTFEDAVASNQSIVVDMLNMDKKTRTSILKFIEGKAKEYEKIAIVFNNGGENIKDTIFKLSKKRQKEIELAGGSKTIGEDVIDRIIGTYEEPAKDEGFNKIIFYDNSKELAKIVSESVELKDIEIVDKSYIKIGDELQRGSIIDHNDLPERMFHVTPFKTKILNDGYLKPQRFGGGFGGGRIAGISVTPSMEVADTYYFGLLLAIKLSKCETRDDLVVIIDWWIKKQKARASGDVDKLKDVFFGEFDSRQEHLKNEIFMEAVESARRIMHGVGGRINDKLGDPIIIGGIERLKVFDDEDVTIFEIMKKDISSSTPVITGTDSGEIRILSDVKMNRNFKPY